MKRTGVRKSRKKNHKFPPQGLNRESPGVEDILKTVKKARMTEIGVGYNRGNVESKKMQDNPADKYLLLIIAGKIRKDQGEGGG